MSLNLPTINFASLAVGATGTVQLPQPKVQIDEQAYLRIYNDSGCGLQITFNDGQGESIPAGAWPTFNIGPTQTQFTWLVTYVLPNPPVTLMSMVYYFPGESVPNTPALGNSPVGIGGAITLTQSQTLYNNGFTAPTQVINVAPLNEGAAVFVYFNDGTAQLFLRTAPNTYVQAGIFQLSEPYVQWGVQGHNFSLQGHLLSQDLGTPSFTNLNANVVNNSIVGDDTRGIVTFDVITGAISAGAVLFTLNFARNYPSTPVILLSNATNQSNSEYHYSSAGASGFSIEPSGSLAVAASYKIAYFVLG